MARASAEPAVVCASAAFKVVSAVLKSVFAMPAVAATSSKTHFNALAISCGAVSTNIAILLVGKAAVRQAWVFAPMVEKSTPPKKMLQLKLPLELKMVPIAVCAVCKEVCALETDAL